MRVARRLEHAADVVQVEADLVHRIEVLKHDEAVDEIDGAVRHLAHLIAMQ
jgi:hypothetical protein